MQRSTFALSSRRLYASKSTLLVLSCFFVLAAFICANKSHYFSQLLAQEPQCAGSASEENSSVRANETSESASNDNAISNDYSRIVLRNGAPVSLDIAVIQYDGKYLAADGASRDVQVDLIGAVHIADKSFYDEINVLFKEYEVVVFELVMDPDVDFTEVIRLEKERKKEERNLNPLNFISYFQEDAAKALGLSYQIDGIDYLAPNLTRGDCSSIEFLTQLLRSGDIPNFFVDLFIQSFAINSLGRFEGAMVALFCSDDLRLTCKRLLAEELNESSIADVKKETCALDVEKTSAERQNVIIHYRNGKAFEALQKELNSGKSKIAVFYGAAHLPDLGKRLEEQLGLERRPEPLWIKAWDMEQN
ncbi:MAG: hypothetical protein ACI4NP_00875 [Thermoguttaceae bacterium]